MRAGRGPHPMPAHAATPRRGAGGGGGGPARPHKSLPVHSVPSHNLRGGGYAPHGTQGGLPPHNRVQITLFGKELGQRGPGAAEEGAHAARKRHCHHGGLRGSLRGRPVPLPRSLPGPHTMRGRTHTLAVTGGRGSHEGQGEDSNAEHEGKRSQGAGWYYFAHTQLYTVAQRLRYDTNGTTCTTCTHARNHAHITTRARTATRAQTHKHHTAIHSARTAAHTQAHHRSTHALYTHTITRMEEGERADRTRSPTR